MEGRGAAAEVVGEAGTAVQGETVVAAAEVAGEEAAAGAAAEGAVEAVAGAGEESEADVDSKRSAVCLNLVANDTQHWTVTHP